MSLWLRPGGEALSRLQAVIDQHGEAFGGEKPKPHVSLLGGIAVPLKDAQNALARLASRLHAPMLSLGGIGSRPGEYYRCFFAEIESSAELENIQALAGEVFQHTSDERFEPHLSLAYGEADKAVGTALAAKLASLHGLRFKPVSIDLVAASGDVPVANWDVVASVPLKV